MSDTNYTELLQELKNYNDNNTVKMWIPSLHDHATFKPLSVRQQTDIINGVMSAETDKNIYAYQNIIDKIILDNCEADAMCHILSVDRACLLLQMRLQTLGDTIEIDDQTYDLKSHVDTFTNMEMNTDIPGNTLSYQGIDVKCSIPTLQNEVKINNAVPAVFSVTTDKESIGQVFLIELAKYIAHVKFSDNMIEFDDLTLKQRVQICEMLPMSLSQQVVEYVEAVRDLELQYVTIATDPDVVEIPIDSQLFSK